MLQTRSGRRVQAPKRYWDEYVATDEWYLREMVSDVPPEEMHAAIEDSDFSESGSQQEIPSEDEGYVQPSDSVSTTSEDSDAPTCDTEPEDAGSEEET